VPTDPAARAIAEALHKKIEQLLADL